MLGIFLLTFTKILSHNRLEILQRKLFFAIYTLINTSIKVYGPLQVHESIMAENSS